MGDAYGDFQEFKATSQVDDGTLMERVKRARRDWFVLCKFLRYCGETSGGMHISAGSIEQLTLLMRPGQNHLWVQIE